VVELSTFIGVTLAAHLTFASGIVLHARSTGRDAGRWPLLTLLFGIVGVIGYVLAGDNR